MKHTDIPLYKDPDGFLDLGASALFPCSSDLMEYRVLVSRYYLKPKALEKHSIELGAISLEQFIEDVTDDLYDAMARLAPFNFQYNCYLVAQSRSLQFPNRYAARKQFEKALIHQAQYKLINNDVRDVGGIDLTSGKVIPNKELRKEFRHISPKALDILQSLGLFFNGNIPHKHLINYSETM